MKINDWIKKCENTIQSNIDCIKILEFLKKEYSVDEIYMQTYSSKEIYIDCTNYNIPINKFNIKCDYIRNICHITLSRYEKKNNVKVFIKICDFTIKLFYEYNNIIPDYTKFNFSKNTKEKFENELKNIFVKNQKLLLSKRGYVPDWYYTIKTFS